MNFHVNRSLLLIFAVLLPTVGGCSTNPRPPVPGSAEEIYLNALAVAKKSGKVVLIVFKHPDVAWCQRLDEYHAAAEVSQILQKYLLAIHIDIVKTPGGSLMFKERGGEERGQPAFTFVDYKGMLLADSGDVGENVGFPNTDDEVARYFASLKTACPKITPDELAVLRAKLEALRLVTPPDCDSID